MDADLRKKGRQVMGAELLRLAVHVGDVLEFGICNDLIEEERRERQSMELVQKNLRRKGFAMVYGHDEQAQSERPRQEELDVDALSLGFVVVLLGLDEPCRCGGCSSCREVK